MRDLTQEELIPFATAPAHYPGTRPHIATVHRHRLRGVRGVKLETLIVGGRRYTSREAIGRFVAALNELPARESDNYGTNLADEALERKLQAEGL